MNLSLKQRILKCFFLLVGMVLICGVKQADAQKNHFEIHITDNASIYNNVINYHLTNDSLIVNGVGDFGRTPVRYISRKLTKKECKSLVKFMKTFPIDSLDDLYNNEFNPVNYDESEYYPRIMEITLVMNEQNHKYRTVNCWVRYSDILFKKINPLIPAEVKIKYDRSQFNAFY